MNTDSNSTYNVFNEFSTFIRTGIEGNKFYEQF